MSYKINFKRNLRIYLQLVKPYKWLAFFAVLFLLFFESLLIVDKFFLKIFVDRAAEYIEGVLSQSDFFNIVIFLLILLAIIVAVRSVSRWLIIHFMNRLDGNVIFDMKTLFYKHILHLSHSFHITHKSGSLISRLTKGASALERMTDVFLMNILPLVVQVVVSAFALFVLDLVSAIIIVIFIILFISYSIYNQTIQQSARIQMNHAEDLDKAYVADSFTNVESIKLYAKEEYVASKFKILISDTQKKSIKAWDYYRWFDGVQTLLIGITIVCIFYFGLVNFISGKIPIGTIVFTFTVFLTLLPTMFGFVWGIRRFYEAMGDFELLAQYLDVENEIKDFTNKKLAIKKGEVEFKDVTFSYHKKVLFNKFNLVVPPNTSVAFVGHSGSGKSTLVKLLFRLYDIKSGAIFIDDQNISQVTQKSLRSSMGVVTQECVLFDDTIYNNILFSNPTASRKQVLRAIELAQLSDVIDNLPHKENTIVGERGVRLSGGEKQRVSIARAILADNKVLVLDEATSSLDSKTEHKIQIALKNLLKGRTSIIIAHRLSTIMHVDNIVVLDNGNIVEQGTHATLLRKKGSYRELWELQKGGYIT